MRSHAFAFGCWCVGSSLGCSASRGYSSQLLIQQPMGVLRQRSHPIRHHPHHHLGLRLTRRPQGAGALAGLRGRMTGCRFCAHAFCGSAACVLAPTQVCCMCLGCNNTTTRNPQRCDAPTPLCLHLSAVNSWHLASLWRLAMDSRTNSSLT